MTSYFQDGGHDVIAAASGGPLLRPPLAAAYLPTVIDSVYYALLFLARDSIYAIARYMPSPVRPSVRLSVRHTGGSVTDG